MDILLWLFWFGSYLAGAVRFELYIVHMFQQNSYKPTEYREWLQVKDNIGRLLGKTLYALVSLPLLSAGGRACLAAACLMNLMSVLVNRPRRAKKPLVYTPRVKRMLAATGIFFAAVVLLSFFAGGMEARICALSLSLLFVLIPVLVLLINLINHPIEEGINRHYINDAARILQEMPNLTVIGVTGSYGKTSVKYFLSRLLSTQFSVLHTPGNYNTTLGVVRTIREQMKSFHEIFICEMGAREVGDIKEICDLVHPRYGIITSIGPQHLQSFHSIENIVRTKFELADAVPADGKVFLNYDNDYIRGRKTDRQVVSYGTQEGVTDYAAYDISVSREGSFFKMKGRDGREFQFHTKLVGNHNVQNIAGAVAVANTLGIPMEKLLYPVKQLESVPHRLQLTKQGNWTILDDAYNSNKSGFKAALDTLAMFEDLRILVTPGMVELGAREYEENEEVGVYAHDKCDYAILVGKKRTKPIQDGLLESGFPEQKMILVDSLEEAFQKINAISGERQKVVLLENDLPDNYN
ncbi:MAG: UDP-N-acetylmuramoyl-tripeptide--D-alanyl-D-alanine ligase [Blautia sp.]|nr:UDP-N-acetylmuramoyl-tripeptide--D-alanyl-D-alanine ligase [Blautia sp.]MCM1202391.1 UDP-N-acetylmuramoyl-tripeptide--D-alanyl-D-alanine ligase [Bacteroides fragilis]